MDQPAGVDRFARAQRAIADHDLDALLALTPENADHLSGLWNFIASRWRTPGLAAAIRTREGAVGVVTGDNGVALPVGSTALHRTYTLWTDYVDLRGTSGGIASAYRAARAGGVPTRPAQYDIAEVYDVVARLISDLDVAGGRIGVEWRLLPAPLAALLTERLPNARFIDCTDLFDDLRAIKDPDELAWLRLAGQLTEQGIATAIAELAEGQTEAQIGARYQRAVLDRIIEDPALTGIRDVEGLVSVGIAGTPRVVGPGVIVKFDMQVDAGGYHSDVGRTVAIAPTPDQQALFDALRAALLDMRARVAPGVRFRDLYEAGMATMRAHGFDAYSRGHLGHSLGLTPNFEEPPFVAPDDARAIAPGMALSLEMPAYVLGVGGFQLETMLFVHEREVEFIDTLPFTLALDEARAGVPR